MSPRDPDDPANLAEIAIRLTLFDARTRLRWAARIDLPGEPGIEGLGALPDEALRELAARLTAGDLERIRQAAEQQTTP